MPSVSTLKRRDLGCCSLFPCRAELFGWLATSLAEGLLAGATSEQVPRTNKNTTQKTLHLVKNVIASRLVANRKGFRKNKYGAFGQEDVKDSQNKDAVTFLLRLVV